MPRAADNDGIERTLRALGLSPLERAHCLIPPNGRLGDAIGAVLSRTATPGTALRVLRSFLEEALSQEDTRVVQVLIEQAGAFGIGLISLWMALDQRRRQALLPLLPPWWAPRLAEVANLEDLCEALHGIPGPLVLDGPIDTIGQHLGPRSLEGPLWVEGHLNLEDCTELESLPDLMVVTGELTISSCPALRKFPKRLEVGYGLWIRDLPRLERSICRAKVGEDVTIVRAPALKLVTLGSWQS